MLRVINSNRTEGLVVALCDVLSEPLAAALTPELLIVPTPAMGQWLRLRLADHFGVCANVEFLYPANFIWEIFRRVLGAALPAAAPFSPEANTWRVFQALGALPAGLAQAPLRAYLQAGDDRHRFQLASEIARCFDQYLVFRPDWIGEWEAGRQGHWQAQMWRSLVGDRRPAHWVHALQDFNRLVRAGGELKLPARATLFGVSALSPAYIEVIAQLGARMDVHVLVLNPCRQYWGDIVSPATVAGADAATPHYLDTGHRLLASMGRPGRDFIDRLLETAAEDHDRYQPPSGASLLSMLQADILDLRDRDGRDLPRLAIEAADRSVQIHACHSPMREVEVLHDQLLAMFERWPDLQPSQVLIAATDFDLYAPFVEAVFDAIVDARHIPISPITRSRLDHEPLIDAFLDLLGLPHSRLTAESILLLLDQSAIARRFDLDEDDVQCIRNWVAEAGIRWGWDAAHRGEQQVPPEFANTWMAGLERLLLGYALPGDDRQLFAGVLPSDTIEGLAAGIFSSLLRFLDVLNHWRRDLARPRALVDWGESLLAMVEDFFTADQDEAAAAVLQCLRDQIMALVRDGQAGGCNESVATEAVTQALRQGLRVANLRPASLRGGVCLADLAAARALPFEVVCVLGLSDGVFPRADQRWDFDLLREDWRRGDRSRRDDDRYLFLETLLSARRCLYLSYVGCDQRTGNELPPSVLVGELVDVIEHGFAMTDGSELRTHLLTRHPLHAFSPAYFNGGAGLFSYRKEYCIAPAAVRGAAAPPLATIALPLPETMVTTPDEFAAFFCHPVRTLMERRFGVRLREYVERIEDDEPFAQSRAQAQSLRERLLQGLLAGGGGEENFRIEVARGEIPTGELGRMTFTRALQDVRQLAEILRTRDMTAALRTVEIDLDLGGVQIRGSLQGVGELGLVQWRAVAEADIWQRLKLWVRHLLLVVGDPSLAGPSWLLTLDGALSCRKPQDARERLSDLVELYKSGMCAPLPFFPRSSVAYFEAARPSAKPGKNAVPRSDAVRLQKALDAWEGDDWRGGEADDIYYRLVFGDEAPIDARFAEIAERVLAPMFEAMESAK